MREASSLPPMTATLVQQAWPRIPARHERGENASLMKHDNRGAPVEGSRRLTISARKGCDATDVD